MRERIRKIRVAPILCDFFHGEENNANQCSRPATHTYEEKYICYVCLLELCMQELEKLSDD